MAIPHPVAIIGTAITVGVAVLLHYVSRALIHKRYSDSRTRYRIHKTVSSVIAVAAVVIIIIFWARLLQHTGTFLGLIGAGIAIALREPLLSIAGRIAIFAGRMYSVGDRIQVQSMKGDVIDIGFFYTILMEVGGWISADQVSGRIVQFANAQVFGTAIFNYTRDFGYLWDEIRLPVTYDSNIKEVTRILQEVGGEYTRQFLEGAASQLEEMQRYFLVPHFELEPQVYLKVTDNWVELSMRYVVEPKKRRAAASFIYTQVFDQIRDCKDVKIASTSMEISVQSSEQGDQKSPKQEERPLEKQLTEDIPRRDAA